MNKTAITIAAMVCGTAAVIGHWQANAGPLDPPAAAFNSPGVPGQTDPSLADIESQIQEIAGTVGTQNGLFCAGLEPGQLTNSYQTIAIGPGIIRKIIVNHVSDAISHKAVDVLVDGEFAGTYRPSIGLSSGGVGFMPVYEVDIAFTSSVQIKEGLGGGATELGFSIHYQVTP